ncbi:neurofilament heavy polypeptide-like [Neocloeon triangulifer]|uniref:neurofilament heavy polypeptide-like n=1 Tax=Neocloeon triangulifer TaxID=2078957 RepID=UPI00286EF5D9|nr:neurofilament heavy polypeptide-like [Neocloeon triangulifer]
MAMGRQQSKKPLTTPPNINERKGSNCSIVSVGSVSHSKIHLLANNRSLARQLNKKRLETRTLRDTNRKLVVACNQAKHAYKRLVEKYNTTITVLKNMQQVVPGIYKDISKAFGRFENLNSSIANFDVENLENLGILNNITLPDDNPPKQNKVPRKRARVNRVRPMKYGLVLGNPVVSLHRLQPPQSALAGLDEVDDTTTDSDTDTNDMSHSGHSDDTTQTDNSHTSENSRPANQTFTKSPNMPSQRVAELTLSVPVLQHSIKTTASPAKRMRLSPLATTSKAVNGRSLNQQQLQLSSPCQVIIENLCSDKSCGPLSRLSVATPTRKASSSMSITPIPSPSARYQKKDQNGEQENNKSSSSPTIKKKLTDQELIKVLTPMQVQIKLKPLKLDSNTESENSPSPKPVKQKNKNTGSINSLSGDEENQLDDDDIDNIFKDIKKTPKVKPTPKKLNAQKKPSNQLKVKMFGNKSPPGKILNKTYVKSKGSPKPEKVTYRRKKLMPKKDEPNGGPSVDTTNEKMEDVMHAKLPKPNLQMNGKFPLSTKPIGVNCLANTDKEEEPVSQNVLPLAINGNEMSDNKVIENDESQKAERQVPQKKQKYKPGPKCRKLAVKTDAEEEKPKSPEEEARKPPEKEEPKPPEKEEPKQPEKEESEPKIFKNQAGKVEKQKCYNSAVPVPKKVRPMPMSKKRELGIVIDEDIQIISEMTVSNMLNLEQIKAEKMSLEASSDGPTETNDDMKSFLHRLSLEDPLEGTSRQHIYKKPVTRPEPCKEKKMSLRHQQNKSYEESPLSEGPIDDDITWRPGMNMGMQSGMLQRGQIGKKK